MQLYIKTSEQEWGRGASWSRRLKMENSRKEVSNREKQHSSYKHAYVAFW